MELNTQLTELRVLKGLSRTHIANAVGISKSYYCMLENGKRSMSVKLAKQLATILETDWLTIYDNAHK